MGKTTYQGKAYIMDTERFRDATYMYLTGHWSQGKAAEIALVSTPTFRKYLQKYIMSGRAKAEFAYYYGVGTKGDSGGDSRQDGVRKDDRRENAGADMPDAEQGQPC